MVTDKANKAKAEEQSYQDAFIAEHNTVSESETELVDQLIELAGDKDKKKIENRLKEIKPTPTLGLLSTLEKISNVNKQAYLSEFSKALHTTMLSFGRD